MNIFKSSVQPALLWLIELSFVALLLLLHTLRACLVGTPCSNIATLYLLSTMLAALP